MEYDHYRPLHLADVQERPRIHRAWERLRHKQTPWVVDFFSEVKVQLQSSLVSNVYFGPRVGVGATASWVLGNLLQIPNLGTHQTVGLAYGLGVAMAIIVCSPQSGGHLSPAVTITFVLFQKFPTKNAIRYIVAQILGGYLGCLFVYLQWKHQFIEIENSLTASGTLDAIRFTPNGPGGVIALYAAPGASLGLVFLNEFVCDFVIGIITWTAVDPTNHLVPPSSVPWVIGLSYTLAIWGFSPVGVILNGGRDIGGRLVAMSLWGLKASGGRFAAIAALTNIPATILAYVVYEIFIADTARVVQPSHRVVLDCDKARVEYRRNQDKPGDFPPSPTSDILEKGQLARTES
ncbi:aquaporin-like protein [Dentipellis sp. KUC8613]|nr:aquaporin-like protein [Dentipellis sp. KUC8613]